ncbi:SLAM family member 9 isoform X2 [Carassius gibelio]|uniref:SLAM family member 9 isoform X2 n=1 Tax=Carassius gibelio TaxID=101364 RepID=UPI002279026A|nr:SLAM family member 9 isoform X2 [Carassius gibelio]
MFHVFVLFCLCWWQLFGVFGVKTAMSVLEGDSVFLRSDCIELHEDDDIVWNFGAENHLIAKIKERQPLYKFDERFRDRLKMDAQTGSLTITNITTQHTGDYKLQISGTRLLSKTFSVSVYAYLAVPVISSTSSNCSSSSLSSSSSQQNCSLVCSVVNVGHVTLSWYKGNSLLSSISVSDLSISLSLPLEVEYQEKNSYSCVINNPITNQTTHLDISQLCHTCSVLDPHFLSQDSLLKMLISVAAGSLLIVAAVWIFWIYRKCRKTEQEVFDDVTVQNHDEELIYADPTFYKRKHMN